MTESIILLSAGLLACALFAMCGRGTRTRRMSFFDVVHDTNRASRRANR